MLANYETKKPYLDNLSKYLNRSWLKKDVTKFNTSSVAISEQKEYYSGLLESKTHLLDINSELAALSIAVSNKDPHIKEVISLVDGDFVLNPIVVKVLCDHVRRTGTNIMYRVYDLQGSELYSLNVMDTYYKPSIEILEKIKYWSLRDNKIRVNYNLGLKEQLRECALKGMETHFSAGTKTLYGAAVLAGDYIYFGGVYSSFDHRMNLHAEMTAAVSAISDGNKEITAVGIISTKFVSDVAHVCGCCKQFLSEIMAKNEKEMKIYCFSFDGSKSLEMPLKDYFPFAWDSNK